MNGDKSIAGENNKSFKNPKGDFNKNSILKGSINKYKADSNSIKSTLEKDPFFNLTGSDKNRTVNSDLESSNKPDYDTSKIENNTEKKGAKSRKNKDKFPKNVYKGEKSNSNMKEPNNDSPNKLINSDSTNLTSDRNVINLQNIDVKKDSLNQLSYPNEKPNENNSQTHENNNNKNYNINSSSTRKNNLKKNPSYSKKKRSLNDIELNIPKGNVNVVGNVIKNGNDRNSKINKNLNEIELNIQNGNGNEVGNVIKNGNDRSSKIKQPKLYNDENKSFSYPPHDSNKFYGDLNNLNNHKNKTNGNRNIYSGDIKRNQNTENKNQERIKI